MNRPSVSVYVELGLRISECNPLKSSVDMSREETRMLTKLSVGMNAIEPRLVSCDGKAQRLFLPDSSGKPWGGERRIAAAGKRTATAILNKGFVSRLPGADRRLR